MKMTFTIEKNPPRFNVGDEVWTCTGPQKYWSNGIVVLILPADKPIGTTIYGMHHYIVEYRHVDAMLELHDESFLHVRKNCGCRFAFLSKCSKND